MPNWTDTASQRVFAIGRQGRRLTTSTCSDCMDNGKNLGIVSRRTPSIPRLSKLTQPAQMIASSQPAFLTITMRVNNLAATAKTPSTVPTVMVAMTAWSVAWPDIAILPRTGEGNPPTNNKDLDANADDGQTRQGNSDHGEKRDGRLRSHTCGMPTLVTL